MCVCVCVCVCVRVRVCVCVYVIDGEGIRVFASRAEVVVSIYNIDDRVVSGRLQ